MGLLQKKICPNCGEEYSALKSSCPACGAKKQSPSTRTPANSDTVRNGTAASRRAQDNTRWQFVFGLCLVAAIIIAVIVLIVTTLKGDYDAPALPSPSPSQIVDESPPPTPKPTPVPTPTPTVDWIKITYYNDERTGFTTSVGGVTPMGTSHFPIEVEGTVEWTSQDENICTVDSSGKVTGVGKGTTTITARLYGAEAVCTVAVN